MKDKKEFLDIPEIKHVIHSNNVCTILWKDGTKTQSACHQEDVYNKDVGFLVAFLKKLMPTEQVIELIEKWSHSQPKQEDVQRKKLIKKSEKKRENVVKYDNFVLGQKELSDNLVALLYLTYNK